MTSSRSGIEDQSSERKVWLSVLVDTENTKDLNVYSPLSFVSLHEIN